MKPLSPCPELKTCLPFRGRSEPWIVQKSIIRANITTAVPRLATPKLRHSKRGPPGRLIQATYFTVTFLIPSGRQLGGIT